MKNLYSTLLLSSFIAMPVCAKPLYKNSGWEFTLSLNTGLATSESNLSTADDNEIIDNINGKAKSHTTFIGFPFARIQYTTKNLNTEFFLGNTGEQISNSQFQYELGLNHKFLDKSILTVAYFPELPMFNEVWEDPYLVGTKRIKTDENIQGGRIELANIAGSPFTLKYAYAQSNIDNEKSGTQLNSVNLNEKQLKSLERDSTYHRVVVEAMYPLSAKIFIKPSLNYTTRAADGDANSYDSYDLKLAFIGVSGRHTSVTTLSFGTTKFDELNPIFDEKQNSMNTGIFSVYTYAEAFNCKDLLFTMIAGYNDKNSNITFFDESGLIASTGIAYTF